MVGVDCDSCHFPEEGGELRLYRIQVLAVALGAQHLKAIQVVEVADVTPGGPEVLQAAHAHTLLRQLEARPIGAAYYPRPSRGSGCTGITPDAPWGQWLTGSWSSWGLSP